MASFRPDTSFTPEIVPFLLTRVDYVGFFLKIDHQESHFTTLLLNRNDINSQTELMQNLAAIYDTVAKT
jgi:hypothetical protein